MVDTAQSGSASVEAAVPPTRRRRRKRSLLYVLGAAILWFIGQGVGWFGAGPSDEQGPRGELGQGAAKPGVSVGANDPDAQPVTAQLATLRGQQDETGAVASPSGLAGDVGRPDSERNQPGGVGTPDASSGPGQQTPTSVWIADDRFQSLVSLIESHIGQDELGEAAGVVQRLMALTLTEDQHQRLAALQLRLQPLRRASEERVLAHVRDGQLLAADQESRRLIVSGVLRAGALTSAAAGLSLGEDWQRAANTTATQALKPEPLERNRKVRMQWRDALRVGVVASTREDQVTVQVRTGGGQSYPTVLAVQCEPTDSSSREAIEMGFHALQAGAPRLARLWLLRAHLLQSELSERGRQLLELLR